MKNLFHRHDPEELSAALKLMDKDREPRWPALIALLAVGGIFVALPPKVAVGPQWLMPLIILILLVPSITSHRMGFHNLNNVIGYVVNSIATVAMIWSLGLLIWALSTESQAHHENPQEMLRSAAALWITNVLVFALWYWRLDGGGPHQRDMRASHTYGAILFPQMALDPDSKAAFCEPNWSPNFVDYLFLAFNTSTALSPTDAPILSRWAKLLSMVQSLISLTVVVILAARAVNIFPSGS